jgi:hypothetical protein
VLIDNMLRTGGIVPKVSHRQGGTLAMEGMEGTEEKEENRKQENMWQGTSQKRNSLYYGGVVLPGTKRSNSKMKREW